MVNKLKALFKEEEGQGMTEYGLVLGVLAVGVIAVLVIFRGQILTLFQDVVDSLTNAGVNPPTNP